jgi:broad specificity phosphatase PhoE
MADDEMPAKVERAYGASEARFPWTIAAEAVDALRALADELERHVEERVDLVDRNPGLGDWEGPYRDDFDTEHGDLEDDGVDGYWSFAAWLRRQADSIIADAESANTAQTRYNEDVEDLDDDELERREETRQMVQDGTIQ